MASTAATAILLLLLLVVVSLPAALADAEFIASTCNKTADPDKCSSMLRRDPRSVNATTVLALVYIGLDIAVANARDSEGVMNDLSNKYDGTPQGEALDLCNQLYATAVDDLEEAREDVSAGSYNDASSLASSAEDAGDKCEAAFADRKVRSVVGDVDQRMKNWCGVAGDLIDLLDVPAVQSRRF